MTDERSMLVELGVVVDRDYAVPAGMWETAVRVAVASTERSSRGG